MSEEKKTAAEMLKDKIAEMSDDDRAAYDNMCVAVEAVGKSITDLNLSPAAVVDLLAALYAEVVCRSAVNRAGANHVLAFFNNRVNQLIDSFEEAGLPAWIERKHDS